MGQIFLSRKLFTLLDTFCLTIQILMIYFGFSCQINIRFLKLLHFSTCIIQFNQFNPAQNSNKNVKPMNSPMTFLFPKKITFVTKVDLHFENFKCSFSKFSSRTCIKLSCFRLKNEKHSEHFSHAKRVCIRRIDITFRSGLMAFCVHHSLYLKSPSSKSID